MQGKMRRDGSFPLSVINLTNRPYQAKKKGRITLAFPIIAGPGEHAEKTPGDVE
jgi:hypothetical protein